MMLNLPLTTVCALMFNALALLAQSPATAPATSSPATQPQPDSAGGILVIMHPSPDRSKLYNCVYRLPLDTPLLTDSNFLLTLIDRQGNILGQVFPKIETIEREKMRLVEFRLSSQLIKKSTLSFAINPNAKSQTTITLTLGDTPTARKQNDKIVFEPLE